MPKKVREGFNVIGHDRRQSDMNCKCATLSSSFIPLSLVFSNTFKKRGKKRKKRKKKKRKSYCAQTNKNQNNNVAC